MVNFFSLGAETLSGMDPVNASGSSEHADFRTAVRQVWHKTHEDLQALSPSTAPFRSVVLEWWVECGEKCGVNIEASYEPTMGPSSGTRRWRKDNGCAWRECLCFGERPYHKLRVCKRCKKVMYCSIKCQTR
ncbi:uncharacterized protein PHACADRAFT_254940 [Phanerochaete carnosa HHB-10118-sp]|uniref:MYND-type domain-containing protein n=1 Tax=Phanerochaete carnosa (strain HHB-10118-sp) TaxID=650164 RepID=K5W0A4_PHACS|nr:uncharacterized protein PHACADRAFT_254940 [Phanerochaete carnosa HHB-10118-sp]EKM57263.1 hypothetical protein PHACADRAFT_254940 [Phanerochaete carnosa HHB-10118-sp]